MSAPILVETNFGPVECRVQGEGPAILAIHGGMGGYDQSTLLARALAPDDASCRVIAVSRPGYLGTPLAVGRDPETQADALAALLDKLDVPLAAVVAVSAGGPSALQLAIRHRKRCRALVLVSACTGPLATPGRVLSRLKLMRNLASVPGLAAFLRRRVGRDPDRAARRSIPDEALRRSTLADPKAGPLLQALQSSVFDRLSMRLPGTRNDIERYRELAAIPFHRIEIPTLLVHGDSDEVVPSSHAAAAHSGIAGSELMSIGGAGHVALFTHLAQVRERSAPYLELGAR